MFKHLALLLFLLGVPSWALASTCTITGEIDDGAGNPVANAVVTFNTLYTQVISGETIAQTLVSSTTDASGQLSSIALAQGVYVQVNINGGAPVTAIVPFSASTTFSALISNIVTNPTLTQLTITGVPTTSQPTCTANAATLYFDTTIGFAMLDNNCGGYGEVLTAQNQFPDCQDVAGNHLNYIASTGMLTCGNTSSGGGGGGSSPPFSDASALVMNNSDNTKRLIFSAASISTATTRTVTIPDRNSTMATSSGTLTSGHLVKFDASGNVVDDGIALTAISGNTATAATTSGTFTAGNVVTSDASGNLIDAGSAFVSPKFAIATNNHAPANGSTTYMPAMGPPTGGFTSENENQSIIAVAGTVKNMYCATGVAPGTAKSWAFTYRKNGVATTMTCTISGNAAVTCNDTTHTFSVAAGDLLSVQLVPTGSPSAVAGLACGAEVDPS